LLTGLVEIRHRSLEQTGSARSWKPLLTILAVLGVYLVFALYRLGWADLAPDEGRYGLAAVNILTDHRQLAVLSEDPLGEPGSKPFMYAASVAGFIIIFGKHEFALRLVSAVALLAAGLVLFALVDSCVDDRRVSILTLFFFLLNPWTISYARTAMPEPTLVLWGCLGVFAAARFVQTQRLIWALVCGLGLGLAFLTKLWLVFPFALTSTVLLAGMWAPGQTRRIAAAVSVMAFAFLLASASHLLLVLWWTPADLSHWLRYYLFVSLSSRLAGQDQDPTMWFHPWWFYLAGLFKATFFALPVFYLAIYTLVRRGERILVAVVTAALSPLLVLSLFTVKQTSYAYPAFPAVAFLLAYGTLAALRNRIEAALIIATVLSAATALFFFVLGVIRSQELSLIWGLYLLYIIASITTERYRRLSAAVVAASALVAVMGADLLAVRTSLQHRTYYRELGAYFRPSLALTPPRRVIFQAPEFSVLEYYLFRTGEYWQTYYFHETYDDFVTNLKRGTKAFYVVDPTGTLYGNKVSSDKLKALQAYAIDVTLRVERAVGRKLGLQVFVSSAWAHQQSETAFSQNR
jgi:4-amino-4-deoxy-L-arabinose transferase-like glycosyltransferase